jgi:glucokinase
MSVRVLAGDIGGTKSSLALYGVEAGGRLALIREASFPSRQYAGLEDVARTFLESDMERPAAAAFGVAGPVLDGVVVTTNLPWHVEAASLARAIGCPRVRLLNDLETTAYGALFQPREQICTLNIGTRRRGHCAVIAAGTGLGQAVLFWDGARYHPAATEGGHADFAPRDATQIALLEFLLERYPRVSWERVLSGPGLHNLFRFLDEGLHRPVAAAMRQRMQQEDPSAVVGSAGVAGSCATCSEAVELFVSLYGAQAGNLALAVMALGGMYIGGGIVTKLLPKMTGGAFMEAFTAKQPFADLMAEIPVHILLNPQTSRIGAAHAAAELVEQ